MLNSFCVCSVLNAYTVMVMMTEKCTLCRQPYKCRHTSGRDLHDPLAISEDAGEYHLNENIRAIDAIFY